MHKKFELIGQIITMQRQDWYAYESYTHMGVMIMIREHRNKQKCSFHVHASNENN